MSYSMNAALAAFLEHRSLKAGNVSSTGSSLLSYGWWEMARHTPDGIIVRSGPAPSQSTKCQQTRLGLYRWSSSPVQTPVNQAHMNLNSNTVVGGLP